MEKPVCFSDHATEQNFQANKRHPNQTNIIIITLIICVESIIIIIRC